MLNYYAVVFLVRQGPLGILTKMFRDRLTTLSFLCFLEKSKENYPKTRNFVLTRLLKSLAKKGKTLNKARQSSQGESNKKKTRKGRTGKLRFFGILVIFTVAEFKFLRFLDRYFCQILPTRVFVCLLTVVTGLPSDLKSPVRKDRQKIRRISRRRQF